MTNSLGGVSFPQTNPLPTDRSYTHTFTGTLNGERVILGASDKSLLASALEEASFGAAERKRERDLTNRRVDNLSPARIKAIEQASLYLDKSKELDEQERLQVFLKQLLNQPDTSTGQVRRTTTQLFVDVTQQYLALSYVAAQLRALRQRGAGRFEEDLLDSVETLLEEMMQENRAGISAGINIAEVASSFAGQQLGTLNRLRQFYRDAVLDYGNLSGTFKKIVEQYGEDRFSQALGYLLSALGADLAAEGPSLPKERLEMIIEDLYKLQSLEALDDETSELLAQLRRIYAEQSLPTKLELMGKLLELLDLKWISAAHLNNLTEALRISDTVAIFFLRGFKELIRLIPLKVYRDPFERDKLIDAVQECLDRYIEKELPQ